MVDAISWNAALGSLRGVAVGDSLGLVYEGLSSKRNTKLYPFPLRQRICFGRGFLSDDTVQSALVLCALSRCQGDQDIFVKQLGKGLRTWFWSIPPGIGLSTIKACLRLSVGVSASCSGIYSAGNGAAMRVAPLGAAFSKDRDRRIAFVDACSRVTHTHPLALQGAHIIALAAALTAEGEEAKFDDQVREIASDWPWSERGSSGYVVHSVNAAIDVWRSSTTWQNAMEQVIALGGDTDTIGAMVGGILGASQRYGPIPSEWERYTGWPQTKDAEAIQKGRSVSYLRLLGTHALELPVILGHGFRRLFPPY